MKRSFVWLLVSLMVFGAVCVIRPEPVKADSGDETQIASASAATQRNISADQSKAQGPDAADECFLEFISSDVGSAEVFYTSFPLYDEDLQIAGRQYDFEAAGSEGYALLKEIRGEGKTLYEIEELFYQQASPFDGCQGLPVYVTFGLYLDYRDGDFYDLKNGLLLEEEWVREQAFQGFGYGGSGVFVPQTQTVAYSSKTTEEYSIPYDLPNYTGKAGETTCANTAGSVLIGYYDRFCENLIPNYKVYTQFGSRVKYKPMSAEINSLVATLKGLMNTDQEHLGTTFAEFQEGMEQYVRGKGYSYSTASLFTLGNFNFERYKEAVKDEKPVAIFLSSYAMLDSITKNGNTDVIASGFSAMTHVAVGCGYRCDSYFGANGQLLETRRYLKVASCVDKYGVGYLNINGLGKMDRAISVEIW